MYIADTLSRACCPGIDNPDSENLELFVHSATSALPISEKRLTELKNATATDVVLQAVITVHYSWPAYRHDVPAAARRFWDLRGEVHVEDGLGFAGD